jgi:hypothetical protein
VSSGATKPWLLGGGCTGAVAREAAVDVGLDAHQRVGRQLVQVDLDIAVAVPLLALVVAAGVESAQAAHSLTGGRARGRGAGGTRTVGMEEACWIMVRTSMSWCGDNRFTFWLSRARATSSSSGLITVAGAALATGVAALFVVRVGACGG